MKAAIVTEFGKAPAYGDFQEPVAGDCETIVRVSAAPLSPMVKALTSGTHYTSGAQASFVPGVDGVGTDPEGRRVYFLFPKPPFGSIGELALVSNEMTVDIPEDLSDVRAAAVATGGLDSWVALTRRAPIQPGATVLVNDASGAAGGMAVQIAQYFGAARVIAVGRSRERLNRLEVGARIALDDSADEALRAEFARGVDVVLDFLWGEPATRVIAAATKNRGARSGAPRMRYVQLGTVAGDEIPLRGDAFRSSGLGLISSGIDSVAISKLWAGARELLAETSKAGFEVPVTTLPLTVVTDAWSGPGDVRYILSPVARAL